MTLGVVVASGDPLPSVDREGVAEGLDDRLVRQLRSLGLRTLVVRAGSIDEVGSQGRDVPALVPPDADLGDTLAAVLAATYDDVLVVPADLLASDHALKSFVAKPNAASELLLTRDGEKAALLLRRNDVPHGLRSDFGSTLGADPIAWLSAAAAGIEPVDVSPLLAVRAPRQDVVDRVAGRLEARALENDRLRACVKANDSAVATFLVSPYSRYVARWAYVQGISPNLITLLALLLGLTGAVALSSQNTGVLVLGVLLLYASFVADCVDGQAARYGASFTVLGTRMDGIFDRIKEYAVLAGLAVGAAATHDMSWLLAGVAVAVHGLRQSIDYGFVYLAGAAGGRWQAITISERAEQSGLKWLKRTVAFPIGERLLVAGLGALVIGQFATLVVIVCWSLLAAVLQAAGRVMRST